MHKLNSYDKEYLETAKSVAVNSSCIKRRYGCIIVNHGVIVSKGYNHSPSNDQDCSKSMKCNRPDADIGKNYDKCPSVHAEQMALVSTDSDDLKDAIMYLSCEVLTNLCKFANDSEHCTGDCSTDCTGFDVQWVEVIDPRPCVHCERMIKYSGVSQLITQTETINY